MKKVLQILLLGLAVSFTVVPSFAATTPTPSTTPVPTATPTPIGGQSIDGLDKQLNNLKERIASRVAQLNLVDKRGIVGTVTDVNGTQITITDIQGNTRYIDVDELTQFMSTSSKQIGISDITKGSAIGILGLYNKESKRILARFIDEMTLPTLISGAVTNIDKENYEITVSTPDKKDRIVEIDTITKTVVYGKDTGLVRSGFSKIQQGERVFVVGYPDTKNNTKLIAGRIIRMPDVAVNPKIVILKPDEMGITSSTGSGVKLAPLIKSK